MFVASRGVMSPLLFSPSVRRMTTFDFASESRSTFSPVARPVPMAVPPASVPVSIGATSFCDAA
jgi:hypothetical protein